MKFYCHRAASNMPNYWQSCIIHPENIRYLPYRSPLIRIICQCQNFIKKSISSKTFEKFVFALGNFFSFPFQKSNLKFANFIWIQSYFKGLRPRRVQTKEEITNPKKFPQTLIKIPTYLSLPIASKTQI